MTPKDLPPENKAAMSASAAKGRLAWKEGDLAAAEASFLDAWQAIPEPRAEYDYAQSLARGLVDFYRDTKQYEKASSWLPTVREVYGGGYNPSVEFLAARVAFEAGDTDEAFRIFDELYKQYKARPFEGYDSKYLKFYKQRAGKR
jgi:tetratricopeptide (TPR) repeat protein